MTRSNLNFNINDIYAGATIGRPLQFTGISGVQPMIFHAENKYRIYGLTIIRRATNGRPYRMYGKSIFSIIRFHYRICVNINIYSTGIQKSILVFVYII